MHSGINGRLRRFNFIYLLFVIGMAKGFGRVPEGKGRKKVIA
jgi:hypothetical protein